MVHIRTRAPTVPDDLHHVSPVTEYLLTVLADAQQHRHEYRTFNHAAGEFDWVTHERQVMLDAVNGLRRRAGRTPVDAARVTNVETAASGHIDYSCKYATGCAFLVVIDDYA